MTYQTKHYAAAAFTSDLVDGKGQIVARFDGPNHAVNAATCCKMVNLARSPSVALPAAVAFVVACDDESGPNTFAVDVNRA